jgi:hypothetical protein
MQNVNNSKGTSEVVLISLPEIGHIVEGTSVINHKDMGGIYLPMQDAATLFSPWIVDKKAVSIYDVFISYRWNVFDTRVVQDLEDALCYYSVGGSNRSIAVFLDLTRLPIGQNFQAEFGRSLINSSQAILMFSFEALERMVWHNPTVIDNLLVEWLISVACLEGKKGRVKKVIPIMMGKRRKSNNSSVAVVEIGSLFADEGIVEPGKDGRKVKGKILELVADVVPTASIGKAKEIFEMNGLAFPATMETITVRKLIKDKVYALNGVVASGKSADELLLQCSEMIIRELRDIVIAAENEEERVIDSSFIGPFLRECGLPKVRMSDMMRCPCFHDIMIDIGCSEHLCSCSDCATAIDVTRGGQAAVQGAKAGKYFEISSNEQ